ncbi:hypothetical protein GQ651_12510 [Alphaproteobacteria bacterium GH1-50]|uniref:DUF6455 domain-containing protein n=1 Tax=Kangsaoukella pontilimi TaxID=2691042 RepID=A0A7C9IQ18_9RHOB|nr:DUF6455 family protein [Kangsaoukella pontilimi]MXQ08670.1 hypothetical protein [Kangsaoukella pontilimi]
MSILTRLERHERLLDRMADRNGADLDLALQSGAISPGEVRAAVLACTGCTDPEGCEARLDRGETGLPDYCRNADLVRSVARVMGAAD